ncbi:MAG: MBL fold metallo-hydrolase, partial [Chthoniobacterales bacterium]
SAQEQAPGTRTVRPGALFNAGRHFLRSRLTPGHRPGGTTFVIEGQLLSAAITGDALFAGSIGGVRGNYSAALSAIRHEILSLPDGTIICPGHGPMTTVGQEKENNPFF